MEVGIYEHKAQYYETDAMGIIHHSNYIRWFEEARIDLLDKLGIGYGVMEKAGVISPVISVKCEYKSMTHFNDIVVIETKVVEYTGVKLVLSYIIKDKETAEIRCIGESKHCFLNGEGKPVSLKRSYPHFHEKISEYIG